MQKTDWEPDYTVNKNVDIDKIAELVKSAFIASCDDGDDEGSEVNDYLTELYNAFYPGASRMMTTEESIKYSQDNEPKADDSTTKQTAHPNASSGELDLLRLKIQAEIQLNRAKVYSLFLYNYIESLHCRSTNGGVIKLFTITGIEQEAIQQMVSDIHDNVIAASAFVENLKLVDN